MVCKEITEEVRERIVAFFHEHWGSTEMVISSGVFKCEKLEGFFVQEYDQIIGLVTYRLLENEIEIISLDSIQEGKGIGAKLVEKVESVAKLKDLNEVSLITTNDNLNALKFYQKRGYRIIEVISDAVNVARTVKPSIPLIGYNEIPLQDELRLRKFIY